MHRLIKRLHCALLGHQYQVHQRFSSHSRRVICPRCKGDWGMNDEVKAFIRWSPELETMYRDLFGIQIIQPW